MKNIIVLLLFFIVSGAQVYSQSTTGNLEGWVLDSNNQPVIGANVYITSTDLQGHRGAATDIRGNFRIQALPVGSYSVKISHIAYQQVLVNNVNIFLGQTTSIGEINLSEKVIETDAVIVSGSKPVIDISTASNSKSLSAGQYANIPIERNYFHIAELLPHANRSYKGEGTNFAGATGVENRYFVDGAEVSTPTTGILFFELPYNFIRQVEIQTGGYQAEFSTTLGGLINTITYSGGNEFHGTLFGFYTNNNFSREPRFSSGQPPKGNYLNYDIGFGIGGPIIKDKLWYYLAYDPSHESEDIYVEGLGMQNSHNMKHKLAAKLTWSPNFDNMITLSITGNPSTSRNVSTSAEGFEILNPEACTRNESMLILNSSLKGIHNLSKNLILESGISFFVFNSSINPINERGKEPVYEDYINRYASGGVGFTSVNPKMNLINTSIKATLILGRHNIKGGFEYTVSSTTRDDNFIGMQRGLNGYWTWEYNLRGKVSQHNFSSFIQDSWQVSPRFCINAGIRWDPQWLFGSDGNMAQKILDQVQPRFGIIYQPGEIGIQKISASFGRFYEPLQLSMSTFYHIKGAYYNQTYYPNDPRVDTSGAFVYPNLNPFVTNIPDLQGQYYDEFSVGYERLIARDYKVGVRGIYRYLGQGIEDGVVSPELQAEYQTLQIYGNPGRGMLSSLPKMERKYLALEFTFEHFSQSGLSFLISYVLSKNSGNYDGLAETSDVTGGSFVWGNATNQFAIPERMINSYGLLPNDRTHVLKLFGSYSFDFGLSMGITFHYMTGTPLNEFGVDSVFQASTFLQPRGEAGRTPSIWDLNFRFTYDFSDIVKIGNSMRFILDILHFASQRSALDYDQYRYADYAETIVNPHYMVPVQFQPPMSVRLGVEMDF